MKILLLGDIVGAKTIQYLGKILWALRRDQSIDMVVANGENASDIMGLSAEDAQALLNYGVDVITGGNHTFHNRSLYRMLDDSPFLLRPANCADAAPGVGSTIFECCGTRIFVLNLLGMMSLDAYASPFDTADRILKREAGKFDFALVDFHAESTAEKEALGYYRSRRIRHPYACTDRRRAYPAGRNGVYHRSRHVRSRRRRSRYRLRRDFKTVFNRYATKIYSGGRRHPFARRPAYSERTQSRAHRTLSAVADFPKVSQNFICLSQLSVILLA